MTDSGENHEAHNNMTFSRIEAIQVKLLLTERKVTCMALEMRLGF
jgi:hypothetical protein